MHCPEQILIKNKVFMLTMYGSRDVPRRRVPLGEWLNPLRYSLLVRRPVFFVINAGGRGSHWWANFRHQYIGGRLCKWFGFHTRPKFREGQNLCLYCKVGQGWRDDP